MGYAKTTSRIDSQNRRKTLNESLASAGLLFFDKGDDVCMKNIKVHHLFTLIGFMNIYPWIPYYVPIYAIGDTFYYMKNGVPTIY